MLDRGGNAVPAVKNDAVVSGEDAALRWESVKAVLRREAGEHNFRSWLQPVGFLSCGGGVLELSAPTRFMRDWVRAHYADRIRALWAQDAAPLARVDVTVVSSSTPATAADPAPAIPSPANDQPRSAAEDSLSSPLDPRCSFAHFMTGPANALAAAAARKVADGVSEFNPLYIHGGVGLGKTHLLQAIAAEARAQRPAARVVYMTAERFMHRFVEALRSKDTMAFKAACRGIDMLLIDDLQFVCGKEKTQDELLSALDALMSEGKAVAVVADRVPGALDGIDARLRSRLSGGLVARIEVPDQALRLSILQSKRALLKRDIPDAVLEFLAANVTSTARELEGALNRLIAHAELMGRALTPETAQELLSDLLRAGTRRASIEDIQKAVAARYGLKLADFLSPRRARNVARPRQVAMYLAKALTTHSLPDIGRRFGGRDHTTIIHGVRRIEELMAEDAGFASEVEALRREIEG
jgi:chromosomal replication initiator protein